MICDHCKKREAVFHVTEIVDGKRQDVYLCPLCASGKDPVSDSSDLDLIGDEFFRRMIYTDYLEHADDEPACARCGMTYSEFNRLGYLGCPDCYNAFAEELKPLMQRIHGAVKHVGKVPNRGSGVFRTVHHIKRLRQHLQKLVRDERFEEAALGRDEIRALEGSLEHSGGKGGAL